MMEIKILSPPPPPSPPPPKIKKALQRDLMIGGYRVVSLEVNSLDPTQLYCLKVINMWWHFGRVHEIN